MKKNISVFLIFSVYLSNASAIYIDKNDIKSEAKVTEVFELMTIKQEISKFKNFDEAKSYTEEYDKIVLDEFNNLSVKEKYEVIRMAKEENTMQLKQTKISNEEIVINEIMNYLEAKNIFIWDLSNEELEKIAQAKIEAYGFGAYPCNAPKRNFPYHKYQLTPPSSASLYRSYYFTDVMSPGGEFFCDLELQIMVQYIDLQHYQELGYN